MRLIDQVSLRRYIRSVLREAAAPADINTAITQFNSALGRLDDETKSENIGAREGYKIRMKAFSSITAGIEDALTSIATMAGTGFNGRIAAAVDYTISNAIRLRNEFNFDSLSGRVEEEMESAGAPADKLPAMVSDYITKLKTTEPKIAAAIAKATDSVDTMISTGFDDPDENNRREALSLVPAVTEKFDAAVESIRSTFDDPETIRLVRAMTSAFASMPNISKISGVYDMTLLLGGDKSGLSNADDVVAHILKNFDHRIRDFSSTKEELLKQAERLTAIVKSMPATLKKLKKLMDIPEDKSEAPPGSPLGQIAFAMSRPKKPIEPNTEFEDELLTALESHFEGDEHLPKKYVRAIKQYMERGWYKDIFKPTSVAVVYRGISVTEDKLARMLGLSDINDVRRQPKGKSKVNYIYGKDDDSSSWTKKLKSATTFAANTAIEEGLPYKVVMTAKVADNPGIFVSAENMYGVAELETYVAEAEEIGLGAVKVDSITWSPVRSGDDYE